MDAANQLKNWGAVGEHNIPLEVYKTCLTRFISRDHEQFRQIFSSDWGTSILLPIFKKCDRTVLEMGRQV